MPKELIPTIRGEYWQLRHEEGLSHDDAFARVWELQSGMSEDDLQKDRAKEPTLIFPITPTDAFTRLFPSLKPNLVRKPKWRTPSWQAPPPSESVKVDECIGPLVEAVPRKDRTIAWMVEQYYESREFVLGGGVWKEQQKRYVRRWLKDDRGKGGPVGEHPIAASRVLFAELSRTRHSAKTDEACFEVKALWSVFLWGFRRGLWSFRDRPVSDWLDRAGLMERGVRDPYSEARWGVVQAAQVAEDAGKIEAEIRAANTSRNKKRRLLIKLVKAAESVADSVRIEDLAPLLRRPFQRADPNEIMLAVRRADDHLSAIVIASKDLLEDFDCAEKSLAKRDVRTNAWAQVFVRSLARTYTLLTGNEPTVSEGKFLKFVEASYLSIWRGRGTPVWVHQVETALGKAKKPRNRAKIAARRAKP